MRRVDGQYLANGRTAGLPGRARTALGLAGVAALALAASGCSTGAGKDPGDTLGNLLAFNSPRAPATPNTGAKPVYDINCPIVDVIEGGAAQRVYSGRGSSNQDVRYQFSIGQTARECSMANGQIAIRVGVEGKVLLGPAGSASSFNVPVKIAVRDEASQQMLVAKTYQVAVTIPPGAPHSTFSVVSEPMLVPFRRKEANEDYMIMVGIEKTKAKPQRRRRVSRRR
ncbi:MAG: hypothetical protein KDJ29_00030 [Hyphomicrobiales bacterium]|nr:hypothetical protein [Hyphomicrobiales bacterium]